MYKELNERFFDAMLERALYEEMERELEALPAEDEIRRLFPYTKRQIREARRLKHIIDHRDEKPVFCHIKRVAVILLCVITASFGLLLTDDGIRAAVDEKLKEIVEMILPMSYHAEIDDVIKEHNEEKGCYAVDFNDVTVADREAAEAEFNIENVEVTYIPEGFEMYESIESKIFKNYIYVNNSNDSISVEFRISGTTDFTVDSERTTKEKVTVNRNDAILFYIDNESSGCIYWGNEIYVCVISGNLPKEELIKVAEGIKY